MGQEQGHGPRNGLHVSLWDILLDVTLVIIILLLYTFVNTL